MIPREELLRIAQRKGLSGKNGEKDYLLDLTLHALSKFGDTLIFKGGTALYKFYNLNRFSEDLDFTQNTRRINLEKIGNTVLYTLSLIGIQGIIDEQHRYKNEINLRFLFRGPLYDGSKASMTRITLNISARERPQYVQKSLLFPEYRDIPSFELYILEGKEILAEKIRAIMTREKPRDVYDLWFLLQRGIPVDENLVQKKLKIYKIQFERQEFFRQVQRKHGAWNSDLRGLLIGSLPDFNNVVDDIQRMFS